MVLSLVVCVLHYFREPSKRKGVFVDSIRWLGAFSKRSFTIKSFMLKKYHRILEEDEW